MKPEDAHCTQEQFEGLHAALEKARANAKKVEVNRKALVNLLIDHSALWAENKF